MKLINNKKKKKLNFSRLAVLGVVGYVAVTLVNQQIQINQKKKKLDELTEQVAIQQMKNDQLRSIADSDSDEYNNYIERMARSSLDLTKKGERVFVNISGN